MDIRPSAYFGELKNKFDLILLYHVLASLVFFCFRIFNIKLFNLGDLRSYNRLHFFCCEIIDRQGRVREVP